MHAVLTIAMEQTYVVVTVGNTLFTVTTDISHRIIYHVQVRVVKKAYPVLLQIPV